MYSAIDAQLTPFIVLHPSCLGMCRRACSCHHATMSPIHAVSGDKSYNPSAIIPSYILTCHCENATKRVQQTTLHKGEAHKAMLCDKIR